MVALLLAGAADLQAVDFESEVAPLLQKYCYDCHGPEHQKAGLSFSQYQTEADFKADPDVLEMVQFVMEEGEMPPKAEEKQLTVAENDLLLHWLEATLAAIENATPNDPGLVVMPRLNHREYARVLRDLTGKPIDVTSFLVRDSTAGEGFLNVGQAQGMGVGQFEGFFAAAKKAAEHLIATPTGGLLWSDGPREVGETEQEVAEAVQQLYLEFLDRACKPIYEERFAALQKEKKGVLAPYLEAAWRYQHREALGQPDATFASIAAEAEPALFPSGISRWWQLLHWKDSSDDSVRGWVNGSIFLQRLIDQWHALPAPGETTPEELAKAFRQLERYRAQRINDGVFNHDYSRIEISPGSYFSEPRQRQKAENRKGLQTFHIDLTKPRNGLFYLLIADGSDGNEDDFVIWQRGEVLFDDGTKKPWEEVFTEVVDREGNRIAWGSHPLGETLPAGSIGVQAPSALKLKVPDGAKELRCEVVLDPKHGRNASTLNLVDDRLPDDLHWFDGRRMLGSNGGGVSNRARALEIATVHLRSSAGPHYHNISTGAAKMKESRKKQEIETANKRRALAFFWADEELASQLGIQPPPEGGTFFSPTAYYFFPTEEYLPFFSDAEKAEFEQLSQWVRDTTTRASNPSDPETDRARAAVALDELVTKAWREEVSDEQLERLLGFYDAGRAAGRSYTVALRAALVPALMHPNFLYRFTPGRGEEISPVDGIDLAERLAFLLWGSLPDERLLAAGREGKLTEPDVVRSEIRRMLADPRGRGFAEEFAGFWLQFADFNDNAAPDPERFDTFTPKLKQAMNAEPIAFFQDLFAHNQPVTDALAADYTFLNEILAEHYGIDGVEGDAMRKVSTAGTPRGGILGMGSFLTKYSAPLRTSPVRRGTWIYEYVLGIHLPPPPPDVPMLSDDERNAAGESVRVQLERHREDPACFSCHDKIDPLGIALERFDAVGAWRETDLAGEPVDDQGTFVASGRTLDGVKGLRAFLLENEDQFVRQFARKLTGYALGRAVEVTDRPLIEEMTLKLQENDNRPLEAMVTLFTSPQFQLRREFFGDAPVASTMP